MNASINGTTRPEYRGLKLFNLIVALMLVLTALGTAGPTPAASEHAQPLLLQMAAQNPRQIVDVIVQKTVSDAGLEAQVAALGGRVTKELGIIHAFAAELPVGAALDLSSRSGVRWVSLDAPVQQSGTTASTLTWATGVGTLVANGFTNPAKMADSLFGANGTYGYGSKVKGSFVGFFPEATPDHAITKVEIALRVYTSATLGGGDDPHVMLYVGGKQVKNYGINHQLFAPFVGAAKAGTLYVDFTPGYTWHWSDFQQTVEVVIDQTMFNSGHIIYYDAVGLRITSDLGTDTTIGTVASSGATYATVDPSVDVNVYNRVIHSGSLWNSGAKLQGKGVTVAVVDSGFYPTKDLATRVVASVNFNMAYHNTADLYGHGTFVAGILGGNGALSGSKYIGVAPQVNLVNVRVSDDQGMSYESDVINGLQWVLDYKDTYQIRVINLSLNSSVAQSYNTSPMDAALEILWFNGIVGVVSAGNNGTATLYPPANDPFVISVGATNDLATAGTTDDTMATFSAYGTTESGYAKPDVVTPGTNIIGPLPSDAGLTMSIAHPANQVNANYFKMSGTSVSAPMVSGAVAILLQDEPNLNPDQVKYRLMSTANKNWAGYNAAKAGAGYLDVYAAVNGTTTQSANTNTLPSQLLSTGTDPITFGSVGWNSVGWNSVGWNSVGWNSVGWNSVGWNSDYWGK